MTLVQTLLTPTGVLQVSDRQLTFPSGKAFESPANKVVIWCEHMVVGFSGMAFTDSAGQCTISEWIVHKLRGARTVEDAAQSLVLGGNELMAGRDDDELGKLTMILAGAPPGINRNLLYRISNVAHPAQPAQRYFDVKIMHVPLRQGEYRYHTAGVLINPVYQQSYEKELAGIHSNFGANHAAKSMVALQRRVREAELAEKLGSRVGREAMVVWLPAVAESKSVVFIATGTESADIDERWAMYSFIDAYTFSQVRFEPHFVCADAVRIAHLSG
ncbi:hypothetical protein HGA11_08855 [Mycolicibacterium septicum DSM 44393]|uniref:Uncharacterized protein n=1 Tax=Mycolicibacterium septicum DSM 44393 TaxID=1341646 RepID=A0A7X6MLN6_9MYCO|nr:hypothetical protein [Mycolicibacterium septicum]NKZ11085.1 hypothetical protein [Mycolicibacterium septicum DSM 44393]